MLHCSHSHFGSGVLVKCECGEKERGGKLATDVTGEARLHKNSQELQEFTREHKGYTRGVSPPRLGRYGKVELAGWGVLAGPGTLLVGEGLWLLRSCCNTGCSSQTARVSSARTIC